MNINCNEFDRLLSERASFRGDADASLRVHAETCTRCAQVWRDEQIVKAAATKWNAAVPDSDLVERVASRWSEESVAITPVLARPTRSSGNRLLLSVVASALLVAVGSLLFNAGSTRPSEGTGRFDIPVATTPKSSGTESTQPDSGGPYRLVVDGARQQYANVADSVTRKIDLVKLPRLDDVKKFRAFDRAAPGQPKTPGWGAGLQPVGRDVRKAFGFLRHAVPVFSDSST